MRRFALALVLLASTPAFSTVWWVKQTATAGNDGTTAARAWGYSTLAAQTWATKFGDDDTICVIGAITSAFVVGAHAAATQMTIDGGTQTPGSLCYEPALTLAAGSILTGGGNAMTIGGAGVNHTTVKNMAIRATAGASIRLNGDVASLTDINIFNVNGDNSSGAGLSFKCTVAANYTQVTVYDSSFDSQGTQGLLCRADSAPSGQFVTVTDFWMVRSSFDDNGEEGVAFYDSSSADDDPLTPGVNEKTQTCNLHLVNFQLHDSQALRNGHIGFRIGNAGHCHVNGAINATGLIANENGDGEGGGGYLFSGFGVAGRTRAQVLTAAFEGSTGGNSGCYFGNLMADQNHGQNSGYNFFALNGCLVEHITGTNTTINESGTFAPGDGCPGEGCQEAGGIIDGNCIILDEEVDETVAQFMFAAGCRGNRNADNSGACIMTLRQTDNLTIRYSYGTNCKTGLWVTGRDVHGLQIYNVTMTNIWPQAASDVTGDEATDGDAYGGDGIRHTNSITDATEIWIRNSIFTAKTPNTGTTGYNSGEATDTLSSYNLFYNFAVARVNEGLHTGDLYGVDPLLTGGTYLSPNHYKLASSSSPAFDSALSIPYTGVDADGVSVPQNGLPDRGAFEGFGLIASGVCRQ